MKVNIDEFRRKLTDYIDPYEIPGVMQALIESSEDTESFEIWKENHAYETGMATEEGLR